MTLERFGTKGGDGLPHPFHLYSMRQAIEEGFILDVLRNYMTYQAYYLLEKKIEEDPAFEWSRASARVARFARLHETALGQKAEVIVEHFLRHVLPELGGAAKAMVVTSITAFAEVFYHSIELADLEAHPVFGGRLKLREPRPIATIAEIKDAGIAISPNPTPCKGIPQGTPISAVLSNLYMVDFDQAARDLCAGIGAFYRRYSDDILVICPPNRAADVEAELGRLIAAEKLEISAAKTERTLFDMAHPHRRRGKSAQYLGFNLTETGPSIRESSLSKRWRRMRWSMKAARAKALSQVSWGRADRLWTKKLRQRFSAQRGMNFASYGRRSASAFADQRVILRQLRRLERAADHEMESIQREVEERASRIRIVKPSSPSS